MATKIKGKTTMEVLTVVASELDEKHAKKRDSPNKDPAARKRGTELSSTKVRLPKVYMLERGARLRETFSKQLDDVFYDNPGEDHFHGKNDATFPTPLPLVDLITSKVRLNQTRKPYILRQEAEEYEKALALKKQRGERTQRPKYFWQGKCQTVDMFIPPTMAKELEQAVKDNERFLKLDDGFISPISRLSPSSFSVPDMILSALYKDMLDWVHHNGEVIERFESGLKAKGAKKKAEKEGTANVTPINPKQVAALAAEQTDFRQEVRCMNKLKKAAKSKPVAETVEGLSAEKTLEALELSKKLTDLFAG